MVFVRFFGGVNTIGGNKIYLRDGNNEGTVMLDFGDSYGQIEQYYSWWQSPPIDKVLQYYKELNILPFNDSYNPDLHGLYHPRLLESSFIDMTPPDDMPIDAFLITHPHPDHYQSLAFTTPEIPIYCSKGTHEIIKVWEMIQNPRLMNNITGFKQSGIQTDYIPLGDYYKVYDPTKDKTVTKKVKKIEVIDEKTGKKMKVPKPGEPTATHTRVIIETTITDKKEKRDFRTDEIGRGETRGDLRFGDLYIETYAVDHSIGSVGMLIQGSDCNLVYTGDLKMGGLHPAYTRNFIEKAAEMDPDVLIIEGTHIDMTDKNTEYWVEKRCIEMISEERFKDRGVLVDYSFSNTDRHEVMKNVAKWTGRRLVVSPKRYRFLKSLENRLYRRKMDRGRLTDGLGVYMRYKKNYKSWEERIFDDSRLLVTDNDIGRNSGQYMVDVNLPRAEKILDFLAYGKEFKGGLCLISRTEPWDERTQTDYERYNSWLALNDIEPYRIHVSNHIDQSSFIKIVKAIKPKNLIGVHTEQPWLMRELVGDITNVVMVKPSRLYSIEKEVELVV